jgi:hypothetical protein
MIRKLLLGLLFALPVCGQSVMFPGPGVSAGASSGGTFSLVQQTAYSTGGCTSSTTCAITVTSTGSSHFGVICAHTNTGTVTISSISSGTWTTLFHYNVSGSIGGGSCAYTFSLPSGQTSFTVTFSAAVTSLSTFQEWAYSGASAQIDPGTSGGYGSVSDPAASTFPGVGLTLNCTRCLVIQEVWTSGGSVSSISSPYTNFQGTSFRGDASLANASNSSASTAPTWTNSNSTNTAYAVALAIQGN